MKIISVLGSFKCFQDCMIKEKQTCWNIYLQGFKGKFYCRELILKANHSTVAVLRLSDCICRWHFHYIITVLWDLKILTHQLQLQRVKSSVSGWRNSLWNILCKLYFCRSFNSQFTKSSQPLSLKTLWASVLTNDWKANIITHVTPSQVTKLVHKKWSAPSLVMSLCAHVASWGWKWQAKTRCQT